MKKAIELNWAQVWGVWMRNFTVYRQTWAMSLAPRFFEPLFYLIGMGLGLGAFVGEKIEGQAYVAFVGPALVAVSAMNGASFEVTYTMFVRRTRKIYESFLSTPVMVSDIMMGEILWATTRATLYGYIFYLFLVIFAFLGFPLVLYPPSALTVFPMIALTGFFFACFGALYNAYITVIDLFSIYFTLIITPLFLFSGVFFPLSRLPWAESVAWWTPLYHSVELVRGVVQRGFQPSDVSHVVWLLMASFVAYVLAVRKMTQRLCP